MQDLAELKMQDVDVDANSEEAHKGPISLPSNEPQHVTIDFSDITSRYQDISPLGCGADALIFSAVDQQCRRRLAVKKVSLKKCHSSNLLKRLFREIRILRRLDHENVVRIYHTLVSARTRDFGSPLHLKNGSRQTSKLNTPSQPPLDAVYIGMELMDTDLQNVLQHRSLSPHYTRLFLYQLLRGLKYIHSANVLHRDITPSNVFLNIDTLMVKIGDFGVARVFDTDYDHTGHLSMTSTTTKYQAPELLLHPRHYSKAVDIWAAGCVFAEMLSGKPLFSGENASEQIDQILNSISVTEANWKSVAISVCKDNRCCPDPDAYGIRDNGGQPSLPLHDLLPNASPMAINLLRQMLTFDPEDRITATDALMHPYLSSYAQSGDEPSCGRPFRIEDELDDFTVSKYQELLRSDASNAPSLVSDESVIVETSTEDSTAAMRKPYSTDSCKNLLTLVQSSDPSNGSLHSGAVTMSESEARTMACDFDYGVQITDGSVNRERMCLDFLPIRSNSACFDPYKWDAPNSETRPINQAKATSEIAYHKTPNHDGNHSDHGYHSSYCSSNLSHGKLLPHSMWSFSSPDVSIDHERTVSIHRASTPDLGEAMSPGALDADELQSDSRNSPNLCSDDKVDHFEGSGRRRHKDDAPRHHQSYGHHHYHHHHHHHHHHGHHHHHKHHRHSSRHGNSSQQQQHSNSNEGDSSNTSSNTSSNGSSRCLQRRCVVNDTVPEAAEESAVGEVSKQEATLDSQFTQNDKEPTEFGAEKKSSKCSLRNKHDKSEKQVNTEKPKADTTADSGFQDVKSNNVYEAASDTQLVTKSSKSAHKSAKNGFLKFGSNPGASEYLDTSVSQVKVTGASRTRTRSDGSQIKRSERLVSTIQHGLNQFCFGLMKKSSSQSSDCSSGFCQPMKLIERIRTSSADRTILDQISESMTDKNLQIDPDIFEQFSCPPAKCSSGGEKPRNIPRNRVECPF
ncbi:uncharacterized protein LOC143461768 [Clavelina lepadiformis]|uniref:uncharacterized protein LOC143461768 n=1 Tax=Clavelina lepadiformis TaxID=159417 RepID=UPI00404296A4